MEWISVKDSVPKDNVSVLVFDKFTDIFQAYPLYGNWLHYSYKTAEMDKPIHGVSHWMPLPPAPKESPEKITKPISKFEFFNGDTWILRITAAGIVFNHDEWPDSTPSDFAQAFCDVLENQYTISFTKRTTT